MIKKIAYENKVAIQNDEEIARKNKVTDADLNEIKEVVNNNADEITRLKQQTEQALEGKVEKVEGKGLSSNDFTNELKQKLDDLENYDDTEVKQDIADLDTSKASKAELQEVAIALQAELLATRKDLQAGTLEGQDTGESLYLQDSSDARFREFGIGGNSRQEKREGYNLLENKATARTVDGMKFTINEDKSITINGTSTAQIDFYVAGQYGSTEDILKDVLKEETVLTINGTKNANIEMYASSGFSNNGNNITTNAITKLTYVFYRIPANITLSNYTVYPMVYKGTDNKEYEPYGAMPSLEFPSEIEAVGQDVNIFDKDNVTKINAYLDGNSKKITTNANARTLYIPCKTNKTYTILKKESARFGAGTCNVLPSNNVICNNAKVPNAGTEVSIETGNTDTYLCVFYYLSTADTLTEQEILDSIKIVEGTEINGYSPYNCGSVNVVVENKNKLIIDANNTELNGIKVTNNFDGTVTINGKATKGTNAILSLRKLNLKIGEKYKISVKPISGTAKLLNLNAWLFRVYANDIDSIPFDGTANNSGTVQITNKKGVAFLWFGFTTTVGAFAEFNNYRVAIQIEEGDATDYIAHEEQTLTMPIQKEMLEGDYLDLDNEEEVHTWRKVVLDGVNNKTSYKHDSVLTDTNGFYSIHLPGKSASYNDGNVEAIYCSHLKAKKDVAINAVKENCIWWNGGNSEYVFLSLPFLSISAVNIYLQELYNAGTPVTIYYKLETPTKLSFTDSQKAAAKEIREKLHSYKGGTHVYSVDEISPIFNARYTRDQETYIKDQLKPIIQELTGGN